MVRFPNCKINLGLYITDRRNDGYHDLETVFYPLALQDALEVVPAATSQLHIEGKKVNGDISDNLVWKAYKMLENKFPDRVPALDIYLLKAIPMGAGLGGGSADGAFMLQLLNDYCKLGLSKAELSEMALRLGSDCPFFIYNTPQFAHGRGEVMTPISLDLSGYSIQLVCPDIHVSTAQAFKMIMPRPAPFNLRKLNELPINLWAEYISNDFEIPVFNQYSAIKDIVDQLYMQGAIYAAMSGSGSSVFGIFNKGQKAAINVNIPVETYYIQ